MSYLVELGFAENAEKAKELEGRMTGLLASRDAFDPDFFHGLELSNYDDLLRVFSVNREDYETALRENSWDDKARRSYNYLVNSMLCYMFSPLQDTEKIMARQQVIRRYIGDRDLANRTREMLDGHASLLYSLRDIYNTEMHDVSEQFEKFSEAFKRLRNEDLFGGFSQKLEDLLGNNPIADMSALGQKPILIADKNDFYLVRSGPKGKGVFDLTVNGLFRRERDMMIDYPGSRDDLKSVRNLVMESAPFIYIIGAFLHQADVYVRRKKLGLPVCIPEINDQGIFKVENAYPITTFLNGLSPVLFSFGYDRIIRKFLIGGAHSGGKSELLKNVGGYHIVGLGGGILPCEEGAKIPLTNRIVTSFTKSQEVGRGSLESEEKALLEELRRNGKDDLLLIDEFLNTTNPELALHLSDLLYGGLEGLTPGLANIPGAVLVVDHRASRMEQEGFVFLSPELVLGKPKRDPYEEEPTDKEVLVPTHHFVTGKPNSGEVAEHALQMWERVKKDVARQSESQLQRTFRHNTEDYDINPLGSSLTKLSGGEDEWGRKGERKELRSKQEGFEF